MKNRNEIKITLRHVEDIKKWFYTYVQNFKHGNQATTENTILKEKHSIRVSSEILHIGHSLELNTDELHLAEITAFLHDIGRFEQYARYKTFADGKSVNHALLGVEILTKNKVLNAFEEPIKNLILRIISYHNRASLPDDETKTCLFFAKLLRDADKLDIFRVVTNYYRQKGSHRNEALELDLPDTPEFSDQIIKDLMNKQIVDIKHVKSLNDFKLLQVGWIFDINFDATFSAVRSRRYLDIIQEALPDSKKIQELFEIIQIYLTEKIDGAKK
ncbi:MAG: HD domain-containing protein [Desulfobacteraceae bacterium]|jgi:putative nucleotidyltransferase with HDIG domain|nr:HD domain-containing protein [Desulfobacteraceae bacterium]